MTSAAVAEVALTASVNSSKGVKTFEVFSIRAHWFAVRIVGLQWPFLMNKAVNHVLGTVPSCLDILLETLRCEVELNLQVFKARVSLGRMLKVAHYFSPVG